MLNTGFGHMSRLRADSEAARAGFFQETVLALWRNCPSKRADFASLLDT